MQKLTIILAAALAASIYTETSAQSACYTYNDEDGNPLHGTIRRVSPDGSWAAGGDETYETGAIIIDTARPDEPTILTDGMLLDIDNNGLAVGAWYDVIGYAKYKKAAIYRNGAWERLPLPAEIIGQSYAVAISADSRIIAGHAMCQNSAPDEPGKYFPIVWTLNDETGNYDLTRLYNDLWLPGTFGFFMQDMTPDGKVVCGMQCLDMGDTIAAMLNLETGEYTIWHKIEYKEYSFDYMGNPLYSEGMYLDGLLDGFDETTRFGGMFRYANDRYLFGTHAETYNVQPDGSGEITNYACVYDLLTGEMHDMQTGTFSCGINPENVITGGGKIICDDQEYSLMKYLDLTHTMDFVYGLDDANQVLAGSYIAYEPWGEAYESPMLVTRDKPVFSAIADVAVDTATAAIALDGRTLSVTGADTVAVYTAAGALVTTSSTATLAPGLYIVTAGDTTRKITIK